MKRSEMIKAIAKEFYALTAHGEQLASEALAWFEAQGMQPPLVRVMKESLVLNKKSLEWEHGMISCTVNEWESEE